MSDLGTINILVDVHGQPVVKELATNLNSVAAAANKVSPAAQRVIDNFKRLRDAQREVVQVNNLVTASFSRLHLDSVAKSFNNLTSSTLRYSAATQQSMKGTNRFGVVAQQVGYQVGDFFVQVQSGTNALTAFGQQGTQLAGLLPGLSGAIVGIGIALGTALGMAALRSQDLSINFKKIGEDVLAALEPVQGLINVIGTGLSYAGQAAAKGMEALIQNLDRILVYGATAAALFTGNFVAGLIAATVATASLSGALLFLRGALIRTGIGALIVGAGELVYQFTRVVEATGGFGNALNLLGSVASEVWNKIYLSVAAMWAGIEASWANGQASIYDGLQGAAEAVVSWGNTVAGVFQGAFDAMKAIWGALPSAIGDFAIQAANSMIESVESMLNAVVLRINSFITGLNSALALLPDWAVGEGGISLGTLEDIDLGGLVNKYAGAGTAAGNAAAEAFSSAMDKTYVNTPQLFSGMADAARDTAAGFDEAAVILQEAADKPMTAWEKLKGILTSAGKEAIDTSGWVTKTGTAATGAAKGAKTLAKELTAAEKAAKEFADSMQGYVVGAVQSVSDAFGDFVMRGFKDFKGFVNSILSSFTNMLAQMIALAARNQIMISMGMSGAGMVAGGAASAAGMGMLGGAGMGGLGGIATGIGGAFGTIGSGLMAGAGLALNGGMAGIVGGVTGGISAGGLAGISTAIGAIAAPLLAVAAVFSFFKKKTKELDSGLRITVNNMDALVETFKKTETKRFWGLSRKVSTSTEAASSEIADPIETAVSAIQNSIVDMAGALNIGSEAFDNFYFQLKVSLKGLSAEEATAKVQEELMKVGDAMAEMIPDLVALSQGSETASETLTRLYTSLQLANAYFGPLIDTLFQASLAGADLASTMVQAFGSLDAFNSNMAFFAENFYTQAEQIAWASDRVNKAFTDLGMTAPATADAFRILVEDLMKATTSGVEGAAEQLAAVLAVQQDMLAVSVYEAEQAAEAQRLAIQLGEEARRLQEQLDRDTLRAAEEAAREAQAIAEEAAQKALKIAEEKASVEIKLLELQSKASEALTLKREQELAAVDESNRALLRMTFALEDYNQAMSEATQALEEANRAYESALGDLRSVMEREISAAQSAVDEAKSVFDTALSNSYESLQKNLGNTEQALADAQQALAEAQRRAFEEGIQNRITAVNASFNNLIANLEASLDVAQRKAEASRQVFEALDSALRDRRLASEAATFASRRSALSYVSSGGTDIDKLTSALGVLNEPSEQFFGTFQDYARDFALTTNAIKENRDLAEATMTADEKTVMLLEQQIEQSRASQEAQVEALEKMLVAQEELLTVSQAMEKLITAQENYDQAKEAHDELLLQYPQLQETFISVGDALANHLAAQATFEQVQAQHAELIAQYPMLNESVLTVAQAVTNLGSAIAAQTAATAAQVAAQTALANAIAAANQVTTTGSVPGFAAGGMFGGGPRIVGENGPELEVTGPSRIYNKQDTSNMFRDPDLASAVQGLRNEVSGMRSEQLQLQVEISKNTKRVYDVERKWDIDGLPPVRV